MYMSKDKDFVGISLWRKAVEMLRELARLKNESLSRVLIELVQNELKKYKD